jgi:hypothetical protein
LRKGEDKPTQTVPRQESGGGDMEGALLEKMIREWEILSLLIWRFFSSKPISRIFSGETLAITYKEGGRIF